MKVSTRSPKTKITLLVLFFANLIVSTAQTPPDSIYTLKAGTQIKVRMDNEINSKVSGVNDTFTVVVSAPVEVRDVEVLPIKTVIEGKVIKVTPASFGGSNGTLEVKFERLTMPDGTRRTIDADLVITKNGQMKSSQFFNTVALVGGTTIGALLGGVTGKGKGALIGAGLGAGVGTSAIFLKKGKETRIKADEEFEIRLNREVNLPVKDY